MTPTNYPQPVRREHTTKNLAETVLTLTRENQELRAIIALQKEGLEIIDQLVEAMTNGHEEDREEARAKIRSFLALRETETP